ncbi:hypothetical protein HBA55_35645 [Pseudomaricurvus alkylphenolicus]|uniref:hypothetical protein n=1 Tax=Pseudomaricurvus alkylphenolicus TaxID=1306991 RepID=UPI001421E343|nr:hypothetical protein [Pseudomaricurvus alkylphenolicus]NIB44968.1 hypothetical protein [Pseudomaricurvus alkylphenolicus]
MGIPLWHNWPAGPPLALLAAATQFALSFSLAVTFSAYIQWLFDTGSRALSKFLNVVVGTNLTALGLLVGVHKIMGTTAILVTITPNMVMALLGSVAFYFRAQRATRGPENKTQDG